MKIDYKKILKEDPAFDSYAKEVVFKTFIDLNPGIIAIMYGWYQADIPPHAALNALKLMLLFGGSDDQTRRDSKM